ncbi:MAG: hypothetical protein QOF57_2562 [Frankiaceae bacterium]|jgi:hypothetical protein|nr:hypothetical protein [Frankiaceae bacterium]
MSRRTLAVVALATVLSGSLVGCSRSEDKPFTDGFSTTSPTPVPSAPMTVPFPSNQDNQVVGRGGAGT